VNHVYPELISQHRYLRARVSFYTILDRTQSAPSRSIVVYISASEMTYIVLGGVLNFTHSLTCGV